MEEKAEVFVITEQSLQNKIYYIRGHKVMLDVDLAEIYGYETKNFNRQVKNNSAKFEGDDFMFQLSDEEVEELSRCKNFTLNKGKGRGSNIKYKDRRKNIVIMEKLKAIGCWSIMWVNLLERAHNV